MSNSYYLLLVIVILYIDHNSTSKYSSHLYGELLQDIKEDPHGIKGGKEGYTVFDGAAPT